MATGGPQGLGGARSGRIRYGAGVINSQPTDFPLADSVAELLSADPAGVRFARVFRETFDQLYDGQRTGRYAIEQLSKTEKTHFGSIIEINLRREFDDVIDDGALLDFEIAGHEIDCKFSLKRGGWMLPPESFGQLILVCHADDRAGLWSVGVVRVTLENRRESANRDRKSGLNATGREAIVWLHRDADLPVNVLLQLPEADRAAILEPSSGQQRINELFRRAQLIPVSRNVIATVAQQVDYMKRVRENGGARSQLRSEGYLIPGGDYESHRRLSLELGAPDIAPGEFVSFRVVPTEQHPASALIDGQYWRIAELNEPSNMTAPLLPSTRR